MASLPRMLLRKVSKLQFVLVGLICVGTLVWFHRAFGWVKLPGPGTGHHVQNPPPPIDDTNPLDIMSSLYHGPWRADIPHEVVAGEEFRILFHCTYPDESLCPPLYTVLFHGPARKSIPPENFGSLEWTHRFPHYATLQVSWTLHDPGMYHVYAYPEFVYCAQWNEMDFPWNKASVQGTPFQLNVVPRRDQDRVEGYGVCASTDDARTGRYLSTNAKVSSIQFANLFPNIPSRAFSWAPYKCKIPPRTAQHALSMIPSAKHILWVGDSTLRGPFCRNLWKGLWGDPNGTVCDLRVQGSKFKWTIVNNPETGEERNISLSYLWLAKNLNDAAPSIESLDPPPTHVVFNMGFWITWHSIDEYKEFFSSFLEYMRRFPQVQHVILRTTVHLVRQVSGCTGEVSHWLYPGSGPAPNDSIEFRLGGSIKSRIIFEFARTWNEVNKVNPPFRLSVVDAFQLTGDRMETTADGAHWVNEEEGREDAKSSPWKAYNETRKAYHRHGVGEADDSILDWIWDDFVNERVTL